MIAIDRTMTDNPKNRKGGWSFLKQNGNYRDPMAGFPPLNLLKDNVYVAQIVIIMYYP
jgi:hypothetical protein